MSNRRVAMLKLNVGWLWTSREGKVMCAERVGVLFSRLLNLANCGEVDVLLDHPLVSGVRLAPMSGKEVSAHARSEVLRAGRCCVCGSTDRLEVDHIVPIARGGDGDPGNLQCLCLSCNRSKRDKPMEEWLAARGN